MLPDGWSRQLFKQVLKLDRGSSPRPIVNFITEDDDGVNWIKIGDTKGKDAFIDSTKEKITPEGAKKSRKVSKGEIILSNSMSYGKPYILNIDGYIHDGWFVIRQYQSSLDKWFLIQVLGSELVQRQYKRLAAGGVVTNISSELVYAVKINFPPLPEQRKIAKILSTWDKAISATERLIDNSKQQKKALMQQLLTGKKRLLDDTGRPFEGEWEEVKLGDILKVGGGKDYKHLDAGDIPVYGTGGHMLNVSDFLYDGESVCIGRKGTIDKPMYLKGKFWTVDTLFYTHSFNGALPQFIYQYFLTIKWKKYNEASGVPSLSKSIIENIRVHLPTLKEQNRIASVLTNADKEIKTLEQQLSNLKQEKKALMQQLLTGKRRVKPDDTAAA